MTFEQKNKGLKDIFIPKKFILNRYNIPNENLILFSLVFLRKNNYISQEKYKGQILSLRKGDLLKRKKTHHCKINNIWYNNEKCTQPYTDSLNTFNGQDVSLEDLVHGYMYLHNAPYNYGVNCVLDLMNNFLSEWYPSYLDESFVSWSGIQLEKEIKVRGYRSECDCCGCGHTEISRRLSVEDVQSYLTEYFHNQKRGNLSKIPKHTV